MQVGVDHAGDVAGKVLEVRRRAHIFDFGPQVDDAGVDEHEPSRVVDCPDEHGHLFALDEELCREVGADHVPTLPPRTSSWIRAASAENPLWSQPVSAQGPESAA
jgi:hypothetical protein